MECPSLGAQLLRPRFANNTDPLMVEPQIIMMPTTMEAATVTVDDGRSLDAAVYEYLVACELPDLAATFWQTPRPATALTQTALARAWNEACSCNAKRAPDAGLSLSAVRSAVSPGEVRIVAPNIQRSRPQPERKRHYCTEPGCTASFTKKGNLRRYGRPFSTRCVPWSECAPSLAISTFIWAISHSYAWRLWTTGCPAVVGSLDGPTLTVTFVRTGPPTHAPLFVAPCLTVLHFSGERPYQCSICNKLFTRNSVRWLSVDARMCLICV